MAISKIEMLDELKSQYLYKATFFLRLAACMELSRALMDDSEMLGDERFPPSDKIIKFHSDYNMFPDQPPIDNQDCGVPSQTSETDDSGACRPESFFSEEVKAMMEKKISRLKDIPVVKKPLLSNDEANAIITYVRSHVENIQVNQDISFGIIENFCGTMRHLCLMTSIDNTIECYKLINNIDSLALLVTAKAYQLLGYKSAKMEQSKSNKEGGGAARTEICMDNIKELANRILPPDQRDATITNELPISKAEYDALCKKVLHVAADVSFPTKEKYRKGASKIIGREITYEGKK